MNLLIWVRVNVIIDARCVCCTNITIVVPESIPHTAVRASVCLPENSILLCPTARSGGNVLGVYFRWQNIKNSLKTLSTVWLPFTRMSCVAVFAGGGMLMTPRTRCVFGVNRDGTMQAIAPVLSPTLSMRALNFCVWQIYWTVMNDAAATVGMLCWDVLTAAASAADCVSHRLATFSLVYPCLLISTAVASFLHRVVYLFLI